MMETGPKAQSTSGEGMGFSQCQSQSVYETCASTETLTSCLRSNADSEKLNYRPIIGVLTQKVSSNDEDARGSSYVTASYVKFVEGGGARVVPIKVNRTEEEYIKMFNSINGLLLPGGKGDINMTAHSQVAKLFYKLAVKANDAGDYFPIWGTCQGFQQLAFFADNGNVLTQTDTIAKALPLTFTPEARSSRLFQSFPKDVLDSLENENITANFHKWSLSVQNYSQSPELLKFYKVLTTNWDGPLEFISTMEAHHYPFYAVQWHPEKASYEWIDKPGMVHSGSAKLASFYAALFFVSEAMKSHHHFPSLEEEENAVIYNTCPVYRGTKSIFMENYYFD
ncbi:gamma-glutamyl hydrolase [Gouania willdenowi]|uniref:folate gamma-glutamyl hydrolase n=1 Tax=Gouania willdenowi TaxID=441366 RepID=A0A8C5E3Y8_GOUWI|nr:gamma-glutamyl hydrolase-like [Gouania willdenowi]